MKITFASFALIAGLALTVSASAQTTVSTYKRVRLCTSADKSKQGKAGKIEGTLNLDPDSKNVLFVVNEKVDKTIPYRNISSLEFYMANHMLRILYRNGSGEETYVDMDLPTGEQPNLLKQLQAQTGIAIRLS
ncbi:MAG TPA: hypothetical protein VK670_11255 [Silvibacterium sp.]|nr:hypothetical protein [Silvibacterium sp.]